ncbi:MAG: hypothetical protein ACPLSK_01130 [bacterium]
MSYISEKSPRELFNFLAAHPVLEVGWVGNDPKACRMLVNWVVFILKELGKIEEIKLQETMMIVDGHVGKVFCRTGLLNEVFFESKRPFIIQASKMRPTIEQIVSQECLIPFYVDNGAFYLFEDGYCRDIAPNCEACPLASLCKRYVKWTAYQVWKEN